MSPYTYPAARLAVVGRVLNRNERERAWLATPEGTPLAVWVLDIRDADPRMSL